MWFPKLRDILQYSVKCQKVEKLSYFASCGWILWVGWVCVGDGEVGSGSVDSGCHQLSENIWILLSKHASGWFKWSFSGKVGVMTDRQTHTHKISTYRLGPSVGWAEWKYKNIQFDESKYAQRTNTIRGFKEIQFPQCWCDAWLQTDADLLKKEIRFGAQNKSKHHFPQFWCSSNKRPAAFGLPQPFCDGLKWKSTWQWKLDGYRRATNAEHWL